MKETLTCTGCHKNWKRERSRGRKPILCPKCLKQAASLAISDKKEKEKVKLKAAMKTAPSRKVSKPPTSPVVPVVPQPKPEKEKDIDIRQVYSMLSPKPRNYQELADSTKNGSTWQCPICKHVVTVNLSLLQPPAHKCTPTTVSEKEFVRIA
jgi:hypothetical protein